MTLLDGKFLGRLRQERGRMALLCRRLAVLSGLLLGSGPSLAANVFLQKGEGEIGLDALLELSNQLNLALYCKNVGTAQRIQLGLYVRGDKLPPELQKIDDRKEDEELASYVCTNEVCEERSWKFFESGMGDTYFTTVAFPKNRQKIKSIRVILPNEMRKYEYQGDIEGILKRICR